MLRRLLRFNPCCEVFCGASRAGLAFGVVQYATAPYAMIATADVQARGDACRDSVLPAMEQLRKDADAIETICSKEYWPLPSYNDILFYL